MHLTCPKMPLHGRILLQCRASPAANDAAGFYKIAAVSDIQALTSVLLDQQKADIGCAHTCQRTKQLSAHDRRKTKRRFIQQQNIWRRHQRTPDRHHLLLAAAHGVARTACRSRSFSTETTSTISSLAASFAGPRGKSTNNYQVFADTEFAEDATAFRHQCNARLNDLIGRLHARSRRPWQCARPRRLTGPPADSLARWSCRHHWRLG